MKPLLLVVLLTTLPPCVVDRPEPAQRGRADGGAASGDAATSSPAQRPARAHACLFGTTLASLGTTDTFLVRSSPVDRDTWLPDDARAQLAAFAARLGPEPLAANAPTDVASALAPFGVDHLDRLFVYDVPGARSFVVLSLPEPHARGLVFAERTTRTLARIEEGSFSHCPARAMRCHLDSTYAAFLEDPRFVTVEDRRVTRADALDALTEARVVAAAKVADPHVESTADAFDVADAGEIRLVTRRAAHGLRVFVAVDYGAGDNTYGAIFEHGNEPVVEVHDGDHYACSVLDPP